MNEFAQFLMTIFIFGMFAGMLWVLIVSISIDLIIYFVKRLSKREKAKREEVENIIKYTQTAAKVGKNVKDFKF